METTTNEYLIKVFFKKYLPTSIFCVAAATITMTIDNILAGTLVGGNALAAVNVATPVYVLITLLSSILSAGSGVLTAQYMGGNEKDKVNSVYSTTIITAVILSALMMALLITKASSIAHILGARDADVNEMACDYIFGLSLGVLPMLLNSTLSRFSRILFDSKILAMSMGVMSLSDIVFDVLLAGVLRMGMFGMALASSASTLLSVVIMLRMMAKQKTPLKICRPKQPFKSLGSIFRLGLPDALNSGCSVATSIVANNLLVVLGGTVALSARSVQSSVGSLTASIVMGVGFTIAPFIGLLFGERDSLAIEKLLKQGLKQGLKLCACAYVVVFALAYPICLLFGIRDSETLSLATTAIRLGSASIVFGTVNSMFRYYYQSIGKTWIANLITVCKVCLYAVICMVAFNKFLGLNAIWGSTIFAEIMTLITTFVAVGISGHKFPKKIADFLLLPEDFNGDYPTYEVSIKNDVTKVVELAKDIQSFCTEHNVAKKPAYFTALCIEEMASNVVQYGFKNGLDHFMDIKVSVMEDKVVFRMRDDGKRFNPFEYVRNLEEHEGEHDETLDPFSNIGIRMVRDIATKIDYRYSVGLNYLFVTI